VPDHILDETVTLNALLSPTAYRYYLPAFVCRAIHFKRANYPSPLPAVCPARLPARRSSVTVPRTTRHTRRLITVERVSS
jgi:hypothetical protein